MWFYLNATGETDFSFNLCYIYGQEERTRLLTHSMCMELLGAFYRIENDFHLSIQSPSGRRRQTEQIEGCLRAVRTSMRRWKKDEHTKDEEPVL